VRARDVEDEGSHDLEEEDWRLLPYPFVEIPDTGLSLMGSM